LPASKPLQHLLSASQRRMVADAALQLIVPSAIRSHGDDCILLPPLRRSYALPLPRCPIGNDRVA
jgi:hypothetical protein